MSTVNPQPARQTEAGDPAADLSAVPGGLERLDDATGLKNLQQLIQLRWIAVFGQLVTMAVVNLGFGIALPLQPMLLVLSGLILFNIISQLRWRTQRRVGNNELFLALLVDVAMLTAQLFLSGGATNPFTFLYLLQIALGAVLLQAWSVWTMVAVTLACFIGLVVFGWPLALPRDFENGLASHYMQGILVCFILNAALLVIFIMRISRNLQERDARLAGLRQRAAEEEHIVRMGLLASGAAHELGTPLATLAVILGDWQRMPALTADPDLQQEIGEMQAQVMRCKTIVSGILLSAGETRGESSARTSICTFLDEVAQEWRSTRAVAAFSYRNRVDQDLPMVSDSTLQQMICNVLDNALEASPAWVGLDATRDGDTLTLTVTDRGPGFAPAMLAQLGKPYQSSKGRTGGGLGLFLVVNVARTLGGRVAARNRSEGGAIVTITLPLTAITLANLDREGRHGR
jgi:two-component system sensor histidine kinase RegB